MLKLFLETHSYADFLPSELEILYTVILFKLWSTHCIFVLYFVQVSHIVANKVDCIVWCIVLLDSITLHWGGSERTINMHLHLILESVSAFTQDMGMKMHNIQWVILY